MSALRAELLDDTVTIVSDDNGFHSILVHPVFFTAKFFTRTKRIKRRMADRERLVRKHIFHRKSSFSWSVQQTKTSGPAS